MAISTFTRLLSSEMLKIQFQCCFTATENIRLIRDGEPRTATSTFTQLLSSEMLNTRPTLHHPASSVYVLVSKRVRIIHVDNYHYCHQSSVAAVIADRSHWP